MANYTAARAKHATLAANVADQVTLGYNCPRVVVQNRSTSGYLTVVEGGTAPTLLGDDCYVIGPGQSGTIETPGVTPTKVGLISDAAVAYSVTAG